MAEKKLPTTGDRISVKKFHVSEFNVRAGEPFGDSEEDQQLIANLRTKSAKVVQPFKARPEGEGFGVYVGRRRFLARKLLGAKEFEVGVDVLIEAIGKYEAREASLIENLEVLRKTLNPVARARHLNAVIASSTTGLRGTARRLGIGASTLSEWLKVLELSPKMQDVVEKGLLVYSDALTVAKMGLGKELQEKLAEVLETDGLEAFQRELARIPTGKMKRGIPKGIYQVDRVVWDKRNRKEMSYYDVVVKAAEKKGLKVPEWIKTFIANHIEEIKKEIA